MASNTAWVKIPPTELVAGRNPAAGVTEHKPRSPAHYLWALLIARTYQVFPLLCPHCGGQMRLIAFITSGEEVRNILAHIGADATAAKVAPARGPPLWKRFLGRGGNGSISYDVLCDTLLRALEIPIHESTPINHMGDNTRPR